MKRIFYILPALLLALSSCEDKLDINMNPVQPVTTSANLMLPGIQGNMAYHLYSHARFSTYHSQYITTRYGTSAIEDRWDYNQITRLGAWRWHYFDVGSNAIGLIDRAELENSANYKGVAKIMLAFSYLTATSSFGDMPVQEAYAGDFSPSYDTQDFVYREVSRLLDEGIADIQGSGAEARAMNAASDLIFQGDLGKWVAFANGLKARMHLHTASFDNGYDNVLTHVDQALNNWRDPIYNFSASPQRDWDRNMWGPARPNPQWNFAEIVNNLNNAIPTSFFVDYLTVGQPNMDLDPRTFKIMTPGRNNIFQGAVVSRGLEGKEMDDFPNLYNGFWTADNSPLPYMLKEELYFIKAEAAFYKGDKETALQAYKDGITANMQRLNVSADEISAYMASPKVKKTAGELLISDIMVQKYIALYLQSETWVDMRRHKYQASVYPGLQHPDNALAEFGERWIYRLPYDPQTEYIYNPQEIARLGASARDWVTKPTWVFENSKL